MINKLESIDSPRFKNSKFLSFLKDINNKNIILDEKNNTIIKNENIINKDTTNKLLENSYNKINNKINNIPNEIINISTSDYNNKINSYIKENNFLEAFYLLKSNEIIEKDNSKNFYLLSKIYMDFNRDDLAIEYALKSLEIDSFNINNYIILSNCYINEGNNIKSIYYMLKYLEFNKNYNQNFKANIEGNILLNYEFIKKNMDFNLINIKSLIDYETYEKNKNNIVLEMIKFLNNLINHNITNINNNNQNDIIYYFLGLCYNILSDFNESINNFKKIKNNNNNIYEIYNKIGVIYLNLNNFQESIINFTKALENNKKYPRALSNLGVAYLNKEMYNESIKYFIKSLEIFPEQPDIWNQLLGIFLTINRDDLINIVNKRDINLLKNIYNS
jgi:tetratricopeptide (TPR) repeat protein